MYAVHASSRLASPRSSLVQPWYCTDAVAVARGLERPHGGRAQWLSHSKLPALVSTVEKQQQAALPCCCILTILVNHATQLVKIPSPGGPAHPQAHPREGLHMPEYQAQAAHQLVGGSEQDAAAHTRADGGPDEGGGGDRRGAAGERGA